MYAPSSAKRQKTTRSEATEILQGVGRIEYKPDVPFNTEDNFLYRYYNASERIHGRVMEDWLRPSIYLGNGFTPSPRSSQKPWCDNTPTIENSKKGVRVMFELCIKLGIKFWSGYDSDVAPEGDTFEETQTNFEQMIELLSEYQQKTGIRPLWIGVDFQNNNRYRNGAATNSDANVVTYAAYQVKRALDMALKLNAECFIFNGKQENYMNIINSDLKKEMKHYSRFLKLIINYRDKIGYRGQLLMHSDVKHSGTTYNNDFCSTLVFLKHYNYDRYFNVNVGTGHDFYMANIYGTLGCVDIKNRDITDITNNTLLLRTIIENGGITPGGLTFYLPDKKALFETKDLAEGFIAAIDAYAKALRYAVKLINDATINKSIQLKYSTFTSGMGSKLSGIDVNLDECEEYIKKLHESNANINGTSERTEHWLTVMNRFVDAPLK